MTNLKHVRGKLTLIFPLICAAILAGCSREAKVEKHLERAEKYFHDDRLEEASIEYLNVMRLAPEHPVAIAKLGQIYYDQGQLGNAFALLSKAKTLDSDDVDTRMTLGLLHQFRREFGLARAEADFVLTAQPTNEQAMILLADAVTSTNELQETFQRLEDLRSQVENMPGFHLAVASLHAKQGDLEKTREGIEKALSIAPNYPPAQTAMGSLLLAQRKTQEAEPHLKAAAEGSEWGSLRRLQYAEYLIDQERVEEGKQFLTQMTENAPGYIPARMRLARLEFAQKNYDRCEEILTEILSRDAGNFEARLLSGNLEVARGNSAKALDILERIRSGLPPDRVPANLYYSMAGAHLLNRDISMAVAALNQAVRIQPNYAEAVVLLAELNLRQNEFTAAIIGLNKLLETNPRIPKAYLILAQAYASRGNMDDAFRVYGQLGELLPENPQVPLLVGMLHLQQDQPAEARQSFEKSLAMMPEYLPATEKLIELDIQQEAFDAAQARAQEQVNEKPEAVPSWLLLAKAQMAREDFDGAEASLKKALEIEADSRVALMMLAEVYVKGKKHVEALARLQDLTANNPRDLRAWLQIAMIHDVLKNHEQARDAYLKVLELNPDNIIALNNLAYVYTEHLDNQEEAFRLAQRARELTPFDNGAAADTLGWIIYKRGDYPWAKTLLQESASKLSSEPEVLYHLGMVHYMMGEEASALFNLERALALPKEFSGRDQIAGRLDILKIDPQTAGTAEKARLETLVKESPKDPVVKSKLAAIYAKEGNVQRGAELLLAVVKDNPNNLDATVKLAEWYAGPLNDPAKAMQYARKARELAPESAQVAQQLGQLAYQSGDVQWASSLLQESNRKQPSNPETLFDLARVQFSLGQVSQSVAALEAALAQSDSFSRAAQARTWLAMAKAAESMDAAAAAADQAYQLLQSEPAHLPALYVSALAQEKAGKVDAAQQVYESILSRKQFENFAPAHKRLAIILVEEKEDYAKAYPYATKAREVYPNDAHVAKVLGIIMYDRKDAARAVQLLEQAVASRSEDAVAHYFLGMGLKNEKRNREAVEQLRKALDMKLKPKWADQARNHLAEMQ